MGTLLDYVLQVDWQRTPGYLWYDYEADAFWPIPEHLLGQDNGKAYEAKMLLATPVDFSRRNIVICYPQSLGFDAALLHPSPSGGPTVPVPASSWAPATKVSVFEHAEVSTGRTATVTIPMGSLAVIITAPQVIV